MRSMSLLVAVVGVGLSVFSCGGEEFGGVDTMAGEAGEGTIAAGGSDVATGGSAVTQPSGGRAGSKPIGGAGTASAGASGVAGVAGDNGGGGAPDTPDCSDAVPPELPGDCQKIVCSMGTLTSEPDDSDEPEPRGPCDVPLCEDGQPHFDADPSQCAVNETCGDGQCSCAGCPNGKVPALSTTLCRLPAMVAVSANKTLAGSAAGRVADGDGQTTWNSGALNGVLTITPAAPQAMTAIAVWLTGLADNNVTPEKKYIQVHANVETSTGAAVMKSGNFSFAQASTGPLRLDLGLVSAKKLTLTFESPSSWISVNEVVFEICE